MAKPRVQLDALVIGAFMIITMICVLKFPDLFFEGQYIGDYLDVLGFVVLLFGVLLRMSARGYKKHSSDQGNALVTAGPYQFVRNPMYLATFLIAIGFILPLYPLWTIVIFGCVFYLRFIVEIRKEEAWLKRNFGARYEDYCRRVPRFVPTMASFREANARDIFSPDYLWTTKEKYGLIYLPLVNIVCELAGEYFLWDRLNFVPALINLAIAAFLVTAFVLIKK
jgi:protein-S-isoprenylcysteine O-methyltransferase Ste14